MRLSRNINFQPSVASIAIAAHEYGHALQDKKSYAWLKVKTVMMPFAAIGNKAKLVMAIGAGAIGSTFLMNIGLLLMLLGMLMLILTLPIEFDASRRALTQLTELKLVSESEYDGAKSTAVMGLLLFRMIRK